MTPPPADPPMREERLETALRAVPGLVPATTLAAAAALWWGWWQTQAIYLSGHVWVLPASGLFVHAFLIVLVHDGSHAAITRHAATDRVLMNVGAGLVFLPFWAEPFRRYHLLHHARTNQPDDPLWTPFKRRLFDEHRRLYMLAELVPLLFSVLSIVARERGGGGEGKGPRVSRLLFALSCAVAVATAWVARPSPSFVLWTVFFTNAWASVRHWCEHVGTDPTRESNTFWFPLGMGIGNHDVHHRRPRYAWLTLAIGLFFRPADANPVRMVAGLLTNDAYRHYEAGR